MANVRQAGRAAESFYVDVGTSSVRYLCSRCRSFEHSITSQTLCEKRAIERLQDDGGSGGRQDAVFRKIYARSLGLRPKLNASSMLLVNKAHFVGVGDHRNYNLISSRWPNRDRPVVVGDRNDRLLSNGKPHLFFDLGAARQCDQNAQGHQEPTWN